MTGGTSSWVTSLSTIILHLSSILALGSASSWVCFGFVHMIYPYVLSWIAPAVCVMDTFTLARAEYALVFEVICLCCSRKLVYPDPWNTRTEKSGVFLSFDFNWLLLCVSFKTVLCTNTIRWASPWMILILSVNWKTFITNGSCFRQKRGRLSSNLLVNKTDSNSWQSIMWQHDENLSCFLTHVC